MASSPEVRPWILRARRAGRVALPSSRPIMNQQGENTSSAPVSSQRVQEDGAPVSSGRRRAGQAARKLTRWTSSELRLLSSLRERKLSWDEVKAHFPDRTLDAIRQCWSRTRPRGGQAESNASTSHGVDQASGSEAQEADADVASDSTATIPASGSENQTVSQ